MDVTCTSITWTGSSVIRNFSVIEKKKGALRTVLLFLCSMFVLLAASGVRLFVRFVEGLSYVSKEELGIVVGRALAREDDIGWHQPLIVGARGIVIRLDRCAAQVDSGEQPLGPRIDQDFVLHLPVGAGLGFAAHGTSGYSSFRAQLELRLQQLLHAGIAQKYHHKIHRFKANLCSPRSAGDGKE